MKFSNINHLWGFLIVEELIRSGADYFCVAPGSRSSPLSVSVGRNKKARTFVHFDERGLGFHALGYVSATRKPAVLVCTSGTAVANFFPAVIEASKKKVPLIILTADRPPELRQTGAVQTIDQVGIFGKYVKCQYDLPCPDLLIKPEVILTTIDQALYQAKRSPNGPIHINCMFREPLAPIETKEKFDDYLSGIKKWNQTEAPYTIYTAPQPSQEIAGVEEIIGKLQNAKSGIIVVGKIGDHDQKCVLDLSRKLGWPIFPDTSSGLRLGNREESVIHYFDQMLLSKNWQKKFSSDCVLHLGGRLTSKRFYEFIDEESPEDYIMVLDHHLRNDPMHKVTHRVEANVGIFCEAVSSKLKPVSLRGAPKGRRSNLSNEQRDCFASLAMTTNARNVKLLEKTNQSIDRLLENFLESNDKLSEPAVARIISQQIPEGHGLFLANSMPVRDMDMFADYKGKPVVVGGNRGASGIDGTIASSIGFAEGLEEPVTLLIGDIAFLHDLNSLAMLSKVRVPVIIVVINNNGGGIFSFLPIAQFEDVFEKFYGTPHQLSFENAAQMFSVTYVCAQSQKSFKQSYIKALQKKQSTIIEVKTDRQENLKTHRNLQQAIIAKVLK